MKEMEIIELLHNNSENILHKLKQVMYSYPIELILILLALTLTLISFSQHTQAESTGLISEPTSSNVHPSSENIQIDTVQTNDTITIDVSGAVNTPGVYEASPGARIHNLIEMAGGISHEADVYFVAQNFNMSRFVGDQDKIYVPFMLDIALGHFTEETKILEYLQPLYPSQTADNIVAVENKSTNDTGLHISINTATLEELETLPGIGPTLGQRIIDNRPYETMEDLQEKKC